MKKLRFVLLLLFAIASFGVIAGIIWRHEDVLRSGTVYKFRIEPIDPIDVMRGYYVLMRFTDDFVKVTDSAMATYGAPVFVRLGLGEDGFARPVECSTVRLEGEDVIRAELSLLKGTGDARGIDWRLKYPFERFYLPKEIAEKAEFLFGNRGGSRNGVSKEDSPSYVTVRVRYGGAVAESLYIHGKPVRQAVEEASGN